MFTRWDITSPKVNRFGRNLEHSEYISGAGPGRRLDAIRAVARAGEKAKFCFFCQVSKALSIDFTKFEHNTSISVAMKPMGTEF